MRRAAALLLLFLLLVGCVRRTPGLPPLRVGTTGDYPPFSTGAGGTPGGFDVEVARRFASDLGRPVEFVPFRWSDLLTDLVSGRFDVAMSGVTIRPERALVGTFTRPVAESGAVVLIRPEYARSAARVDLLGLRLGVNAGGYLEQVARRLFPHAILVPSTDNRSLPVQLARGSIEALLTDDVEADTFEAALGTVRRVGPLTRDRKAYLARDPGLARQLDDWVRAHDADGSLGALRSKMLGPMRTGPQTGADSDLRALLALVDLRLAFMPLVAAAKARAGRPVLDPAQEAHVLAAARTDAVGAGLDPDSAARLFEAQIAAARDVQAASLSTTHAAAGPAPPSLEHDLRPALANLSTAIVEHAAVVAKAGPALRELDRDTLADRLDMFVTPANDRAAIAAAIIALRLAPNPPRGS